MNSLCHENSRYLPDSRSQLARLARSCSGERGLWRKRLWRFERNGADVDDILQDALLQAHLCIDRYRGEASLETWFIAVVMNVARQHVAREVRRNALISLQDDDASEAMSTTGVNARDDESSCPDSSLNFHQLLSSLTLALERLPASLRQTFELACVEERSYHEVAAELGVPIGTVRSRVNRARAALRAMLNAG